MFPLGSSLHALAVQRAMGVVPRNGEHVRDTMARAAGAAGDLSGPVAHRAPLHGAIVCCPHARASYKEWPINRWEALIDALREAGHNVLIAPPDSSLCALADLLAGASLVLAVDSGPLHLADALGVPVIGLYAATSSVTYGPYRNRERCIDKHRQAHERLLQAYDSARHITHGDPMRLIAVEDVLTRIAAHG